MSKALRHIILVVMAAMSLAASAQTDAQFTQFWEIANLYNAGAIGTTDSLRIRGGWRQQWVGIEGAPSTFVGTAEMPVKLGNKRLGLGVIAESEGIGLFNSLQIGAQVAYQFRKWGGQFSIGVQVGMYDQKFKGSEVFIPDDDDYHQSTDDAIPMRDIHGTAFDASAGIMYNHKRWWAGISCTHLMSPSITMKAEGTESTTVDQQYEFQAPRTLYFMAGLDLPIRNTRWELLPAVLVKSDLTFTTGQAVMRMRYNKFFNFGVGYRWDDAVFATIGVEYKSFYLGYAYDYSTSAIAKASSGSHEVFAGYALRLNLGDKNKNRHKSIRIM